mmetsp:Transcript_137414/g.242841  ORF Transcript_137414/g.242841 Transcript_137414/m.242841 type:complete len:261 (+) Transcript_137414:69-851(+)
MEVGIGVRLDRKPRASSLKPAGSGELGGVAHALGRPTLDDRPWPRWPWLPNRRGNGRPWPWLDACPSRAFPGSCPGACRRLGGRPRLVDRPELAAVDEAPPACEGDIPTSSMSVSCSSTPFGKKFLIGAASARSRLRSSSTTRWRSSSSSLLFQKSSRSCWRAASYCSRRTCIRRSTSRLCSCTFMRLFWAFICSMRSSSANFASSCSRSLCSSSTCRCLLASTSLWCSSYHCCCSTRSSSFFRIRASSRRRSASLNSSS